MSDVETFYCLIVGSRSFSDYELFVAKCDLLLRNWGSVVIVSGGARGADALAKRYAVDRGYCYMEFPADWDTYGRRAGCHRVLGRKESWNPPELFACRIILQPS